MSLAIEEKFIPNWKAYFAAALAFTLFLYMPIVTFIGYAEDIKLSGETLLNNFKTFACFVVVFIFIGEFMTIYGQKLMRCSLNDKTSYSPKKAAWSWYLGIGIFFFIITAYPTFLLHHASKDMSPAPPKNLAFILGSIIMLWAMLAAIPAAMIFGRLYRFRSPSIDFV